MTLHRLPCSPALGLLLLLAPAPARAEPLGLEDAVRQALANNERALKAPLRVETAEGQLDKARTAFLPSLSAKGTGALQEKNNRLLSANGTLQLDQPLLNLSAIKLHAHARHTLESERWGAAQDERQLAFDTASKFLEALTAEHLLDSARQRAERARTVQQNAEAKLKAQLAGSSDVTLASVDTASAMRDLATEEGDLAVAYVKLGYLVGKPVTGPLAPPDRTLRAAETAQLRAEEVTALAEGRRPDVRAAAEKTLALRASAEEPLFRLAPTLSISGQVKAVPAPTAPDKAIDGSAQLILTWNLYDAGVRGGGRGRGGVTGAP